MLVPWKLKFPNFNQLRLMQIVLFKCLSSGQPFPVEMLCSEARWEILYLSSFLVAFHTVLILYFLKEIIKTNPVRSTVGLSLLLSSFF